jgi:hypothetical protein
LPRSDPYQVFQALMTSGGIPPAQVGQASAARKSVIDLVLGELSTLGSRVGAEDRAKIDAHVTGLRDIETRLAVQASGGGKCSGKSPPPGYEALLLDNDSFPALVKMQTDLLVAALRCDLTRLASVQWSRTFSMLRHTWLGDPNAPPHHTNSHQATPEAINWQYRMSYWYSQQFAYLLGLLKATPEGNGTLLDNTLAVWAYDMNYGDGHVIAPAIAVLAGGLGGTMITGTNGRFIDFGGKYDWTQMLVTICQAMGAKAITKVGDLGVAGAIPGIINA